MHLCIRSSCHPATLPSNLSPHVRLPASARPNREGLLIHPLLNLFRGALTCTAHSGPLAWCHIFVAAGNYAVWLSQGYPNAPLLRALAGWICLWTQIKMTESVERDWYDVNRKLRMECQKQRRITSFLAHESRNQIFGSVGLLRSMEQTKDVATIINSL